MDLHLGTSVLVSSGQEPGDIGRVVDTLDREVAVDHLGQRLEEGGTGDGADISGLGRATGKDDGRTLAGPGEPIL